MNPYFYDVHQVRYKLYQTNEGKPYNWLLFPGGPGADSSYLQSLVDELEMPGNVWLVDLPGNGSNQSEAFSGNFEEWISIFPQVIQQFENPIVVGHSFGGMFPLLFPELETRLKGFVILSSSPVLWLEEAAKYGEQFHLPDLTKDMEVFTQNPNQETFNAALAACLPYYFPKETLEKGKSLLSQLPFAWQPPGWWQQKVIALNFSAQWIPQNVPTLIIGGKYDCVCPFYLFKNDQRFQRSNIEYVFIERGGHLPWVEDPKAVNKAFKDFISRLPKTD